MEEVYEFIGKKLKLTEIDTVVIGVSGGPDSMALLYIMNQFKEKIGFKIICAHVNHNKRPESEKEQKCLEKYCKENNIIFEYIKINNWGDDNFHNEARTVRYNFFDEIINIYSARYLMTAHHGDDLIETILMRIVRGSTLKGYSGFSRIVDKGNYTLVRPLITVTKTEIEDFDIKNNIWYAIDSSNNEDHYTRNRYRHKVLPFLKKEDPNVHKKFLKYSKILLENNEFIENEASKYFNKVFHNGNLNIDKFVQLDKVIQNKIIYNILERIYGDDLFIICDAHVDLIFNLISSNKSNSIVHLPNNLVVIKSYNDLVFTYDEEQTDKYEIEVINIVNLPNGKIIEKTTDTNEISNNIIRLNSKEIALPLYVRNKRNGDKMTIKGMTGTKKISDIFIDDKIKTSERNAWPVVLDSEENIVWLPGLKKSKFDKKISQEYDIILRYR
mgnify:FL=1